MREDDLPGHIGELIRHGRIESVDLAGGRVTVQLGDIVTQPLRWYTGSSGGTRIWVRPVVGEQVTLFAPDGDIAGAIAMRGLDTSSFPPVGDPDRDLVEFADGAIVAYDPTAHAMQVVLPAGAKLSIIAPGGVTIDADVRISGDLTVEGKIAAADDVTAGDISLQQHRHGKVQAGAAKTDIAE